jgi:hypothetical protein
MRKGADDSAQDPGSISDLGPCCICERAQDGTVRTLVMLEFEGPPGHVGWCCVQCHLPARGATAIVCDDCIETHGNRIPNQIRFIMGGTYAAERVRVALEGFTRKAFDHNPDLHPERQAS